jgi:hypothetical protein
MLVCLLLLHCRSAATKFLLIEDGGCLPPPPVLTHLVDKDYTIYEREINNIEGAQIAARF